MKFLIYFLMLVLLKSHDALEFSVRGSSGPLVVPLGGSVLLPCFVDKLFSLEKVEWRKTDSETVVHLYQNGEIRPEAQDKDYQDRAHFFSDDIKHGNFSLLLTNARQKDKGVYRCKVYSGQGADKTLVEIKYVEYLIVLGSDESISAYVGEDVTLNCSVDSHIPPEDIEQVSWKKTDKEEHILVLLYQNKDANPEASDERFRDRVEFFSAEIPRGNFSLRLKSVRTEDKGVYMCQVFAGRISDNTTVVLGQLGLSWLHISVLVLCIIACGFDLLFCSLIYWRPNTGTKPLPQVCLYVWPNVFLLLAFVLWGATEASSYETISCCVVCVLRPLGLLWVTPHINDFPGFIVKYIESSHNDLYFPAVLVTMLSALLAEHFREINTVSRTVIIVLLVLVCVLFIIQLVKPFKKLLFNRMYEKVGKPIAACSFFVLPSVQLGLLLYRLTDYWAVFGAAVLPVFACLSYLCRRDTCARRAQHIYNLLSLCLDKAVWILMSVLSVLLVIIYIAVLKNEKKDDVGLVCMGGFVQVLWSLIFSSYNYSNCWIRSMMFLFGAVGLILVDSVALMIEVMLIAVKGERLMGDLRFGVLPSECLFTIPLLILPIFCTPDNKETPDTKLTSLRENPTQNHADEMESLRNEAGNSVEGIT